MKPASKIFLLSLTAVVLSRFPAAAQTCGAWQSIPSWQGTISISASGSGPDNEDAYTWTVSHQMQSPAPLVPSTTSECTWIGGSLSGTGSVNDQGAGVGSFSGCTASGVGSGAPLAGLTLAIDGTSNTYTLSPDVFQDGTFTNVCDGNTTTTPWDIPLEPFTSACAPKSFTYALPASVGVLKKTGATFTGGADCNIDGGIPGIKFTLSFTLTPGSPSDNVDDQCSQSGGSSIGCQNQSLGEDVPIVGTGFSLHYEGDRAPGRSGANPVAGEDAASFGGWTLNVHHVYDAGNNILFLGDGSQRSAWQLGTPVTYNGNTLLTSKDGSEIYVFNASGQHIQTVKPLTGALQYQFAYDAAGKLISVTDASGNVTTIERNGSEQATSITSPYSQTTTLSVDSNGFLSEVIDPAGDVNQFVNGSGGLITSRTDPNGDVYNYTYDSQGRLSEDADPAGGSTTLTNTILSSGYSVTSTTALGRTSTFQVNTGVLGEELTDTWPDGLQRTYADTQSGSQLFQSLTLPDGTSSSTTLGPDPRWGLQTAVPLSGTLTKGKLTMTTAGSRTASVGTPGDPFSLTSQTDTTTVNGRTSTSVFTVSDLTYLNTSAAERKTATVLDSLERLSSTQIGSLLPVQFAYDSHGRLSTTTQGTRVHTLAYDSNGFLASTTNPLNQTISFTRDLAGRVTTETLADGRVVNYTYDDNGNLTSVTPPGKSAHDFSYTIVNLISAYTPPTVSGTGATTFAYDVDRELRSITRPDGKTIKYAYDKAGRLSSVTTPTETIAYSYSSTTGSMSRASIAGGEAIAYAYNGPLLTSSTWTGTVAGAVSRSYNDNFWVASESINGSNSVSFSYDKDGLPTKAGSLALTTNSNALVTATTLGSATDARSYNTFGELTEYSASYGGSALYTVTFTRDADGRVSGKTESIGGVTNTFKYTYDKSGRLTDVQENNTTVSTYSYDTNSNRLEAITSSGTAKGTYDAQDRMLTYGGTSYTYTANGELATQTAASQTTTYTYDVLGNLIAVTLPNGTAISYIVDSNNRRAGKEVNGVLATGFLYDGNRILAQLNSSNEVVSQFVYASQAQTPDYMISGGITYRIFSDEMGSPRLVVNTSTGAIAEQISYDEFGNVISDTNPGFQPFGFAGGLYDQDTKLLRFGARDYNPAIGRWTAKDPILFAGGDTNLYGYVLNDPVNWTDATGLAGLSDIQQLAQQYIDYVLNNLDPVFNGASLDSIDECTAAEAASTVTVFTGATNVSAGYLNYGLSYLGNALSGLFVIPTSVLQTPDACPNCTY
jgi:RHS repeat-associated protein